MTANAATKKWWQKVLDVVLDEVGALIKEQNARISALEAKVSQFEYRGVWDAGIVYRKNNFVTDGGSVWVCVVENSTRRPGDNMDWKLAVKRGRDARL